MLATTDFSIHRFLFFSDSEMYVLIIHVHLSMMPFCPRFMLQGLVFNSFAHDLHCIVW